MDDAVYVIGHRHPDTDSVCSAIALAYLKNALGEARAIAARAGELNPETSYVLQRFGLASPSLVTDGQGRQLVLVDHNEVAQAVDHVRDGTVLEVWEHHRIGDLDIPRPIVFHCEPVGATATLVAEQFLVNDVEMPPAIAAALLAAILSDTLVFASPTCSDKDRRMARRLAAIAGVDVTALGQELMRARGDLALRPAADIVDADFKEFDLAGHRVGIGQVEAVDVAPIVARRDEFVEALRHVLTERGLLQVVMLVTDITHRGSHVWAVGDRRDVLERALGRPLVDGAMYVEGCMSRKKQVVPPLEQAFARAGTASGPS